MIVWIRNGILIFAVLSAVYAALYFRARWRQKDRLNAEYLAADQTMDQDDYVAKGLEKYNRSFRPKLLLGVYGLPLLLASLLIFLAYQ